jgi:hypothetical protein
VIWKRKKLLKNYRFFSSHRLFAYIIKRMGAIRPGKVGKRLQLFPLQGSSLVRASPLRWKKTAAPQ